MTVLVTGATGFVGKKLIDHLLDQGYFIHVLTHSKNKLDTFKNLNVKCFYWNIENQIIDLESLNGVDVIIHLAGATISKKWTNSYKNEILNSRVNSAKLLYDSLKKIGSHQVKHFISASAIGIYPNSLTATYDENYHASPNSFLAQVVTQWELAASNFELLQIKVSKLRTGLVLDAHSGALPLMIAPTKFFLGSSFGTGKQIYSWIHVDDLVRMYAFILKNELEGVYNAVASQPVSCDFFMQSLAKHLQTKIWLPAIPEIFLKFILGEMAVLLTEGQYVTNEKIKDKEFLFVYTNLDPAIKSCLV